LNYARIIFLLAPNALALHSKFLPRVRGRFFWLRRPMQRKEPDFPPAPRELQTAVQAFPPRQSCWAAAPQRANTQGAPELSRLRRGPSRSDLHTSLPPPELNDIDPEAWLARRAPADQRSPGVTTR